MKETVRWTVFSPWDFASLTTVPKLADEKTLPHYTMIFLQPNPLLREEIQFAFLLRVLYNVIDLQGCYGVILND